MQSVYGYFKRQTFSVNQIIIITSVYMVTIFNWPFLSRIFHQITELEHFSVPFLLSVPVFLFCLICIFLCVISQKYLFRPVLSLLLLVSSLVFYGTVTYGVVFDYGMIENVFETNVSEASSYLNLSSLLFFLLLGGLPVVWLSLINVHYAPWSIEFLQRFKLLVVVFTVLGIIGYFFYSNYAAVGRKNKDLIKYVIPLKFVGDSTKYIKKNYFVESLPFEILDNAPIKLALEDTKTVTVLVVGETARAKNFSLNGYQQPTNQYTEPFAPLFFSDMRSCGTATAVSVPCMFSWLSKENFNKQKANNQQNVLDIAQLAGVDVLWIDNNSSCKKVCQRVPTINIERQPDNPLCDNSYCFDQALLAPLRKKLAHLTEQSTLIVLHMIGSHGPTYYQRYPKEHAIFLPDCPRSDIQNCTERELVNTYDNTIVYTDFVLAQVMAQLSELSGADTSLNANLLYVSDHGESLGEHGIYLHGLPYAFAPDEQTHIPMLYWRAKQNASLDQQCVSALTANSYNHDNIFHSILGLLAIQTRVYDKTQDLFAPCYSQALLARLTQSETK